MQELNPQSKRVCPGGKGGGFSEAAARDALQEVDSISASVRVYGVHSNVLQQGFKGLGGVCGGI